MLNVKSWKFNPFKQKKMKKAGILITVAKKIELCSIFFLQPSVAFWLDFNQDFICYRMKVISGR